MTRLRLRAALLTAVGTLAGVNLAAAQQPVPLPSPVAAPACPAPAMPCLVTGTPVTPAPLGGAPGLAVFQLSNGFPYTPGATPQPGCTLTRLVTAEPCQPCAKPVAVDVLKVAPAGASMVYKLRNTAAADAADAIAKFCSIRKLEVSVVAEPVSNTVLVSAPAELVKEVVTILDKIDRAPPSVHVELMVVEVPADFAEKAGLRPAGEGFGKPCELTERERQMFNVLLRQAKHDGSIEILSRPQLMVQDNQTGHVQVGQAVPCPTPAADGKPATIEMVPVGFSAKVTPRIMPDGKVLMRLGVTMSSPTPQPVALGNGAIAPASAFNVETVETTAVVKDGATAVFGGILHNRQGRVVQAVPVLSNIPYIDRLFTNVAVTTEKTELLVLATAHVVKTPTPVAPPAYAPPPPMPTALPRPVLAQPAVAPVMPPYHPLTATRFVALPPPMAVARPTVPACCEAACGSCDKAKARELVKAYHLACAHGDHAAATRCAVQALAIDPTCFAPSK
jgi:hypothetical protein